jgi:hypothetical protein
VLRRRAGGVGGAEPSFRKINPALVLLAEPGPGETFQTFDDFDVEPGSLFQYRVFYVDENENARQWTITLEAQAAYPPVQASGALAR